MQQAIALPNFGSRNGPTELEQGRVAQPWSRPEGAWPRRAGDRQTSGLQGILRVRLPDGRPGWFGGADPRREGVPWATEPFACGRC